ncbi:hypothetical protein QPL60_23385 [Klebsiella michiganensis]|nr:hypothetical protein [Klebsiella michiganensis]MDK3051834.1 hypothetical protein [Klebsiella michiganensis]MDU2807092.1 hypothetical protein [Klebsiella michiganensis]MDU4795573.1 hypothetical protein [Klebsiella michiganensis]MEB6472140.1 hypothetical protein [Klebsiella michiganensis]
MANETGNAISTVYDQIQ